MEVDKQPDLQIQDDEDDDLVVIQECPSLKRKKTVTWADGQEVADEDAMDIQGDQEPAAVKVEGVDVLFEGLRQDALAGQHHVPIPSSVSEPLTSQQLKARRNQRYEELEDIYREEFWALADELLLRRCALSAGVATTQSKTSQDGITTYKKALNTRSKSKFAEAAKKPEVVSALLQGGLKAAWKAAGFDGPEGHLKPTVHVPNEDDISEFIFQLERPTDEQIEILRKRMVESREQFLGKLSLIGRLEASASAATSRELDRRKALAALCGKSVQFFLRRSAVTIGRGTDAAIDVDLTSEGGATVSKTISRLQAHLFLDGDGQFKIRCIGRRIMNVNGQNMQKGDVAVLPHLSLIKVGAVTLLFVVNMDAMDRIMKRSAAFSILNA